jgi:hypothetical protein
MDRGEDKENSNISNISNTPDRLVQMTGEHHTKDSGLIYTSTNSSGPGH